MLVPAEVGPGDVIALAQASLLNYGALGRHLQRAEIGRPGGLLIFGPQNKSIRAAGSIIINHATEPAELMSAIVGSVGFHWAGRTMSQRHNGRPSSLRLRHIRQESIQVALLRNKRSGRLIGRSAKRSRVCLAPRAAIKRDAIAGRPAEVPAQSREAGRTTSPTVPAMIDHRNDTRERA